MVDRKRKRKAGSPTHYVFHSDVATMGLDDGLADGQPDAGR
jgi:hypothetical protein